MDLEGLVQFGTELNFHSIDRCGKGGGLWASVEMRPLVYPGACLKQRKGIIPSTIVAHVVSQAGADAEGSHCVYH